MRTMSWLGLVMVAALAGGCQPKAPPPLPPPVEPTPTPQMAANLKQEILTSDPLAKVGEVTAVMPQDQTLAVGGVNVADFREGDVMLVIGGNMNTVAHGEVYKVDRANNVVVLKFHDSTRQPERGDLAVRMSDHPLPPGAHVPMPQAGDGSRVPAPNTAAPVNTVPPPATQPAAPAGGADNKPADATPQDSDRKPLPAETAQKPDSGTATNTPVGSETPAPKPSEFNK
jgi:hypothetical protein